MAATLRAGPAARRLPARPRRARWRSRRPRIASTSTIAPFVSANATPVTRPWRTIADVVRCSSSGMSSAIVGGPAEQERRAATRRRRRSVTPSTISGPRGREARRRRRASRHASNASHARCGRPTARASTGCVAAGAPRKLDAARARAASRRARARGGPASLSGRQTRSRIVPVPSPPPQHIVTSACCAVGALELVQRGGDRAGRRSRRPGDRARSRRRSGSPSPCRA